MFSQQRPDHGGVAEQTFATEEAPAGGHDAARTGLPSQNCGVPPGGSIKGDRSGLPEDQTGSFLSTAREGDHPCSRANRWVTDSNSCGGRFVLRRVQGERTLPRYPVSDTGTGTGTEGEQSNHGSLFR